MKIFNPFKNLTKFELSLYLLSLGATTLSFLLSPEQDYLTLVACLIGATALIFVAKGHVVGQILTIAFAVVYGIISFYFRYYGEMLTYLCMTAPIALLSTIEWLKHPYKKSKEVEVAHIGKKQIIIMLSLAAVVTAVFYFILSALGTANIVFSTISVTTSFIASYLTFLRSPYYGLGYAANDIVLIVLWVLATVENPAYFPMIVCFCIFLCNDLYGFFNWRKMRKRQQE